MKERILLLLLLCALSFAQYSTGEMTFSNQQDSSSVEIFKINDPQTVLSMSDISYGAPFSLTLDYQIMPGNLRDILQVWIITSNTTRFQTKTGLSVRYLVSPKLTGFEMYSYNLTASFSRTLVVPKAANSLQLKRGYYVTGFSSSDILSIIQVTDYPGNFFQLVLNTNSPNDWVVLDFVVVDLSLTTGCPTHNLFNGTVQSVNGQVAQARFSLNSFNNTEIMIGLANLQSSSGMFEWTETAGQSIAVGSGEFKFIILQLDVSCTAANTNSIAKTIPFQQSAVNIPVAPIIFPVNANSQPDRVGRWATINSPIVSQQNQPFQSTNPIQSFVSSQNVNTPVMAVPIPSALTPPIPISQASLSPTAAFTSPTITKPAAIPITPILTNMSSPIINLPSTNSLIQIPVQAPTNTLPSIATPILINTSTPLKTLSSVPTDTTVTSVSSTTTITQLPVLSPSPSSDNSDSSDSSTSPDSVGLDKPLADGVWYQPIQPLINPWKILGFVLVGWLCISILAIPLLCCLLYKSRRREQEQNEIIRRYNNEEPGWDVIDRGTDIRLRNQGQIPPVVEMRQVHRVSAIRVSEPIPLVVQAKNVEIVTQQSDLKASFPLDMELTEPSQPSDLEQRIAQVQKTISPQSDLIYSQSVNKSSTPSEVRATRGSEIKTPLLEVDGVTHELHANTQLVAEPEAPHIANTEDKAHQSQQELAKELVSPPQKQEKQSEPQNNFDFEQEISNLSGDYKSLKGVQKQDDDLTQELHSNVEVQEKQAKAVSDDLHDQ